MIVRVVATPHAERQVDAITEWWRTNRAQAPYLFEDELGAALDLLGSQPEIGRPFPQKRTPDLRRFLLRKSGFFVYYVFLRNEARLEVRAVWNAKRGHGPTLG